MTTNGSETIEQYKVGCMCYNNFDTALNALFYERQSTSVVCGIDIIHKP